MSSRFTSLAMSVSALATLLVGIRAPAADGVETISVVVARRDIVAGTKIDDPDKLFRLVRYVKGDEPKTAFTELAKLKGRTLQRTLGEDQPVKLVDFQGLAPVLPSGTRAYAIKTTINGAVAGFVLPGSRIDVIALTKTDGKVDATILLEDIGVLAVNSPDDIGKDKDAVLVVTVAVKPDQATKLAVAAEKGKLSLALRKIGDK